MAVSTSARLKQIEGLGRAHATAKKAGDLVKAERIARLATGLARALPNSPAKRQAIDKFNQGSLSRGRAGTATASRPRPAQTKGPVMAASTALAHRPASASPAFKSLKNKLEEARAAAVKKSHALTAWRAEAEKGHVAKGVVLLAGAAAAYFGPGMLKDKVTGQPKLSRQGRRIARLAAGGLAIFAGRKVHPLLVWAGWGALACEGILTFAEMGKKREDGSPAEFGDPALGAGADANVMIPDFGAPAGAEEDENVLVFA